MFVFGIVLVVLSNPASPDAPRAAVATATSDEAHAAAAQMTTIMDAKAQRRGGDMPSRETASGSANIPCPGEWTTPFNDPGLEGETIYALAVYEGDLYAGGTFTTAGGETVNHIARWDGGQWNAVGDGVNGIVRTMLAHNGSLYAGGHFTTAGGASANRIARWDGEDWEPIGDGFNNAVMTLTKHNGDLIAGGLFTHAGEEVANRVARWDATTGTWQPMGDGMNRSVLALASFDLGLLAGGHFIEADGEPVGRVALWTGNEWIRLGGGFVGHVHTLGILNGVPAAGGAIQSNLSAGADPMYPIFQAQSPTDRLLLWDDVAGWAPFTGALPPTPNHSVNTMADYNGMLHIAGKFSDVRPDNSSPPVPANLIAQWDGASLQPLGEGLGGMYNGSADAMTTFNGKLIVAGYFATAGGEPATSIAAWQQPPFAGPGDINCDGVIDGADLLLLLAAWGECPDPDDCPGDLDGNGVVDGADLLILLANWG